MDMSMHRRVFCLAVLTGCASCVALATAQEKERGDVPQADPVSWKGLRYEAPPWTRARGQSQNGGYVEAIDANTGKSLWLQKVYDSEPTPGKEQDKADVFITRLVLSNDHQTLLIEDERGRRYALRLKTRSVRLIK